MINFFSNKNNQQKRGKMIQKLINILLSIFIIILLIQKVPNLYNNFKMQSQDAPQFEVQDLNFNKVSSTQFNEPKVLVFWATWCGPCKVELGRIQKMIDKNEIEPNSILAISSFEETELVQRHIQEKNYTFPIGIDYDGKIADLFKISGTPTIIFLNKNKIEWVTTGLSPLLEKRILDFIVQDNKNI